MLARSRCSSVRASGLRHSWHTYISYLPQQTHFAFLPKPTSRVPPQQGPRYCGGVSLSLRTPPFLKRTLSARLAPCLVMVLVACLEPAASRAYLYSTVGIWSYCALRWYTPCTVSVL